MDTLDTSFPVRSVSTFDNAAYQAERRKIREKQLREMELSFAAATASWDDVNRSDMSESWIQSSPSSVIADTAERRAREYATDPYGRVNIASLRYSEAEEHLENVELNEGIGICFSEQPKKRYISPIGGCCISFFYHFVGALSRFLYYIVGCWGNRSRKERVGILGILVALPLMTIFLVALASVGSNDSSADPTAPSASPPSGSPPSGGNLNMSGDTINLPAFDSSPKDLERHNTIHNIIVGSGLTDIESLDTKGTAPHLALRWIVDYDGAHLETDLEALIPRYALAVFFFSTHEIITESNGGGDIHIVNGTHWNTLDHWMSEKGICMWYGVSCSSVDHDGTAAVHYNNNTDVLNLTLSGNNLSGTIASELQALKKLQVLDLGRNSLEGSIPQSLGQLAKLEILDFSSNNLEGRVPSHITKLRTLRSLALDHNMFNGTLPDFTILVELSLLHLHNNRFTGTIPEYVERVVYLRDFRLSSNHLVGSISLKAFQLLNLEILHFNDNHLTGEIPDLFNPLRKLKEIQLNNNNFTGTLAPSLGEITGLKVLDMGDNEFSGTIPSAFGKLGELEQLYLFNNKLLGSLPSTIGNMKSLKGLYLDRNKLTGSLPSEISLATNLEVISLHNNLMTGTLPESMGELDQLRGFHFYENDFTGTVPLQVCNLRENHQLAYLAGDCSDENGTIDCDCCHECYPHHVGF